MKYKLFAYTLSAVILCICAALSYLPICSYAPALSEEPENIRDIGNGSYARSAEQTAALCEVFLHDISGYCSYPISQELTESHVDTAPDRPSDAAVKMINVQPIYQLPELPTGCEVVSLTMELNYLGYDADKLTLARKYLPKMRFFRSGGELYGADFKTVFAGDPETKNSYGCYAPCIVITAERYLADNDPDRQVFDMTGTSLDTLLSNYIINDIPVIVWVTSDDLHEPKLTDTWLTLRHEEVQWVAYEHCVVLTGFNKHLGLVFAADPLLGFVAYDHSKFEQRYNELGMQAVYIK